MAGQYDDRNRGGIWKNEKKETDKHPDFTGSLNVDGKDYWVSAWKRKEGANPNSPALSFAVKPKESKAQPASTRASASRPKREEEDSEIPF